MTVTPLKLALYARNSRPPRNWKPSVPGEEPPGSWRQQLASLHRWSEREGHVIIMEEHETKSGSDPNRRGWQRILQEARGHHIDAIVVTKLDRVMRSLPHYVQLVQELLSLGIDLIVVDSGMRISKRDAMSQFMMNQFAVMAQLERDLIKERIADVMELRADGKWYGPRSDNPVGRFATYTAAEGHKMRQRKGHLTHDKAKCKLCRTKPSEGSIPGGAKEAPAVTPPSSPP